MRTLFGRLLAAIGLSVWLITAAVAQTESVIDFERWDSLGANAEKLVDDQSSDEETFAALRQSIAQYREEFNAARNQNAGRIDVLRKQIAALGAPPEGEAAEPEPPSVTAQRDDLNAQLNILLAPAQRAEAAYARADGLIGEIDTILREQQTEKLLSVSPSPLNPANWTIAVKDTLRAFRGIAAETRRAVRIQTPQQRHDALPKSILLLTLGTMLILRGRRWATMIVNRLRLQGARGLSIWRFVVSLMRVLLPYLGLVAFTSAGLSSGLLGTRGEQVLSLLPVVGGFVLGFRWVSERVFSRDDDEALLAFTQDQRKRARFHIAVLTITIVLDVCLREMVALATPHPATQPLVAAPFLFVISFSLFNLGQVLRGYVDPSNDTVPAVEQRVSTLSRVLRWLGKGSIVVAVLAPILWLLGYFNAADVSQGPYVMTLALLGLVMALQRFSADVYGALTGQGEQARDALMPVLFGLVLLLLAMPLLALIWGARVTDLTELWTAFSRGFSIGDSQISPSDFLTFAIIFVAGYTLTRLLQSALRSNVLPKTKMDIGGQNAIVSGLGYIGIFLAALAAITGAGIDLSSLAIVAGALSVGIGFGFQNIVSNFVSGIILLIERPISQGDWIEVGGQMGYVRDISVRSTRIETFDRTDVIVPNADLVSGTVTNFTRGNTVGRVIVTVGVAYGTDTRRVAAILQEIAEAQPMALATPAPNVLFVNFGADALEFEVRIMLRDVNWMMAVKSDVNHAIAERFLAEKIEIPFAQRDLWIRNPEALTGAGPLKATETRNDKGTT